MAKNIKLTMHPYNSEFYYLLKIKINKNNYLNSYKKIYIPKKWQMILMSDGSLTQNLNSFTGSDIYINKFSHLNSVLIDKKKYEVFG